MNFTGSTGTVALEDVPAGTTAHQRQDRLEPAQQGAASLGDTGVGSATLTGADKLPGGDLNGDNVVNLLDYSTLRYHWMTDHAGGRHHRQRERQHRRLRHPAHQLLFHRRSALIPKPAPSITIAINRIKKAFRMRFPAPGTITMVDITAPWSGGGRGGSGSLRPGPSPVTGPGETILDSFHICRGARP